MANVNKNIIKLNLLGKPFFCSSIVFTFVLLTISTLLIFSCKEKKEETTEKVVVQQKPNIIFILADDLGYGDLGVYGQKQILTPHLDKMAANGIRFTNHYSGSTVCAPSRSTLMTGFHTGNAYVRGNNDISITDSILVVPELLKPAGYRTGLIGKWGLGEVGTEGIPTKQGFDFFFGFLNQIRAHNYYPDYIWKNEDKFHLENKIRITRKEGYYANGIGSVSTNKKQYIQDLFLKEALGFIEREKEEPFFLYYAITPPHANNEGWMNDSHGMEVPGGLTPDYGPYDEKDWPESAKGYAQMVSILDSDVGAILKKLEDLGLDENTLVIFASDNGTHAEGDNDPTFFDSNGPLKGIKRDLYEGGIRTPMIAYWPSKIQPGRVSNHISAFWDFMPTACELAGIETPENLDGISYLPELLGKPQPKHDVLYWEFHERDGKQAIRKGKWKGVRVNFQADEHSPLELYDLENDLGETNDLATKYPEIVNELNQLLSKERTRSKFFRFQWEK
nr:arylsulfatase [Allomuricauda sp.]